MSEEDRRKIDALSEQTVAKPTRVPRRATRATTGVTRGRPWKVRDEGCGHRQRFAYGLALWLQSSVVTQMDDAEIIAAVRARDREAFGTLVERSQRTLHAKHTTLQ
ncbi:MAG: hypothetical protein AAB676_21260 [Verrucomicrobiota bacterium]